MNSSSPAATAGPPGTRVLVVDDNADALETMEMLLSAMGFDVGTAGTPAEALTKVRDFVPDAFVLDIGLPGMDGYQLAAELRRAAGPAAAHARFIALTGYGQAADRAKTTAAGFHRHLVKPVNIDTLLDALQQPARANAAD